MINIINKALGHAALLLILPTIAYNLAGHLPAFAVFVLVLLIQEKRS